MATVDGRGIEETHRGEDWYGREFGPDDSFQRMLLVDCDLTEARSEGALFDACVFRHVRFNASVHRGTAFTNCLFERCTLFDAEFADCKAVGSVFDRCEWDITRVTGGDWSFTTLHGADLTSAVLRGVRMREAELARADCSGGVLRDLDLSGAEWEGADLTGCDLRGTDLGSLDPLGVHLAGAIIDVQQAIVVAEGLRLDIRPE